VRASVVGGTLLTAAAALVIVISSGTGLGLEPYALTGVAVGAVVGLVPDRAPLERLGGFVVGFVAVFVGFALRALVLPDATSGRVVATVVTGLLCTLVAFAARGHLPLWSMLLGVAAFSAVYELPFTNAEPEMATTSMDVATSLLSAVAVGFVVASCTAARPRVADIVPPRQRDAEPALGETGFGETGFGETGFGSDETTEITR
jgi:hypothetical protein